MNGINHNDALARNLIEAIDFFLKFHFLLAILPLFAQQYSSVKFLIPLGKQTNTHFILFFQKSWVDSLW